MSREDDRYLLPPQTEYETIAVYRHDIDAYQWFVTQSRGKRRVVGVKRASVQAWRLNEERRPYQALSVFE